MADAPIVAGAWRQRSSTFDLTARKTGNVHLEPKCARCEKTVQDVGTS